MYTSVCLFSTGCHHIVPVHLPHCIYMYDSLHLSLLCVFFTPYMTMMLMLMLMLRFFALQLQPADCSAATRFIH